MSITQVSGRQVLTAGLAAALLPIATMTHVQPATISAQAGIGYLTMNWREFMLTDVVLVGILLYALLGKMTPAAWSKTHNCCPGNGCLTT